MKTRRHECFLATKVGWRGMGKDAVIESVHNSLKRQITNINIFPNLWRYEMSLTDDVKSLALELGADLVGVAPIERFEGAPEFYHPQGLRCR